MNFMSLLGGGGGGGGQPTASSSARSAAASGTGNSSVGINSHDVVWIAVAFAGALALVGILWALTKK
jgi:hypothetical protein